MLTIVVHDGESPKGRSIKLGKSHLHSQERFKMEEDRRTFR